MQPKYIFKSKTALFSALVAVAGALGTYAEPVGQFLSDHAPVITMATGVIAFALRLVTKGSVSLFRE